ncbi:MAG: cytochrome c biogenesis protein CcsA [Armatimonadetes bacterium]|nr:cytochrome c biogenesis protein CcsA [Armatimonadota bacterium]
MNWKSLLFGIAMAGAVVYAMTAPDAKSFQNPGLARIIFFHLPCAFVAVGLIVHSSWMSARFLMTGDKRYDVGNAAAWELAALFAALTMATGVLFSKVQWGAWWQNDPRQTSFLMVLFLCGVGLALRNGLADEQKAAKAAAAYSVATVLPILFLFIVLPRIMSSFHPSNTIMGGGFDRAYWIGLVYSFVMLIWAARYLYVERVRLGMDRHRKEVEDGHDDTDSAGSAGVGAVRPVAVSQVDSEGD